MLSAAKATAILLSVRGQQSRNINQAKSTTEEITRASSACHEKWPATNRLTADMCVRSRLGLSVEADHYLSSSRRLTSNSTDTSGTELIGGTWLETDHMNNDF